VGVNLHEPTLEAMKKSMAEKYPKLKMNDGIMRMAILPEGSNILHGSDWTPIAVLHNVYILPGIPSMVTDMLTCNEEHFVGVPIHRVIVRSALLRSSCALCHANDVFIRSGNAAQVSTLEYEGILAGSLKAVQKDHPNVIIGSYVNLSEEKTGTRDTSFNTRLTVEGRNVEEVKLVGNKLVELFKGKIADPSTTV
jgi:molybdopterin-biosynthesis enzyme MoeA-like protein